MNQQTLRNIQRAAKLIEEDGGDGFRTAVQVAGEEVAVAVYITTLRRNLGSTNTYPADPEIDEIVDRHLAKEIKIEP